MYVCYIFFFWFRLVVDGVFGVYFIYNIKMWPRPDDPLQNKQVFIHWESDPPYLCLICSGTGSGK